MFQLNSFYYIVGFSSEPIKTPRGLRKVEVRVNRPDATVQTRIGYFSPMPAKDRRRRGRAPTPLESVLEVGLPHSGVPIRFSAAPFAASAGRATDVVLTASVLASDRGASHSPIEMLAAAFDRNWKDRAVVHQTIADGDGADSSDHHETLMRMRLKPGTYEVRLAAQTPAGRGSVFEDFVVPDFYKEPLSLSGVLVERSSSRVANSDVIADLVPVRPTAVREFARADHVTMFVRIYQHATTRPANVSITSRIVNDHDEVVSETTAELAAAAFASERQEDYKVSLPMSRLAAGEYLFTMETATGAKTARRDVRFSVHP